MSTLDQDLAAEKRHLVELRARAHGRLQECREEAALHESRARSATADGDADAAVRAERLAKKLTARAKRYEGLFGELDAGGDRLVREVLLARLQGPEIDVLVGEVDRNRDAVLQHATLLLRARNHHRALRQRWGELSGKLRALRVKSDLPPQRFSQIEFRVHPTPADYEQQPGGPSFREVSDLIHELGL